MVAPPRSGKTTPPIPHVSVKSDVPEAEKPPSAAEKKTAGKRKILLLVGGLAAALVAGVGSFIAVKKFMAPPPPPPPATKAKAPGAAPTAATAPKAPASPAAAGAATPGPTPSDTVNALAKVPINAVNKAQDAIAARRASGQTDLDAAAGDLGDKPATAAAPSAGAAKPTQPAMKATTAMTSIGRGVSATTAVEAAVEASPAFRSFVANAKVSGVFQGTPSRAFINGRLARAGETVDGNLGIMFDSVDPERRQLVFKDKSGAIVSRKY